VLRDNARATEIVDVSAGEYYGKYYQDIQVRVPNIEAAQRDLGWQPCTDMDTAIRRTIEFYVKQEGFGTRAVAMAGI
jgi:nucleoside-diphosphate-sugar epimerase